MWRFLCSLSKYIKVGWRKKVISYANNKGENHKLGQAIAGSYSRSIGHIITPLLIILSIVASISSIWEILRLFDAGVTRWCAVTQRWRMEIIGYNRYCSKALILSPLSVKLSQIYFYMYYERITKSLWITIFKQFLKALSRLLFNFVQLFRHCRRCTQIKNI